MPATAPHRPTYVAVAGLALAWLLSVGLLTLVGELVVHSTAVLRFDARVTTFVVNHRSHLLDTAMKLLTWAGTWLAAMAVSAAVIVSALRRRVSVAVVGVILAGWVGEEAGVTVTKNVVQRPRPPDAVHLVVAHGWSFPSGHAANAVVVSVAAVVLVHAWTRRRLLRRLGWAAASALAVLVAYSRVELGVHWATDVLASLVWTAGWLALLYAGCVRAWGPPPASPPPPVSGPRPR